MSLNPVMVWQPFSHVAACIYNRVYQVVCRNVPVIG